MRRGFTLSEMAITLAVTGIVSAIAIPAVGALRDRVATDGAARAIVAAHGRARMLAITTNEQVLLLIRSDSLLIQPRRGGGPLWAGEGPAANGVTLSGPTFPLHLSPMGVSVGVSNATYTVQRGAVVRRVIISRWGRIRQSP